MTSFESVYLACFASGVTQSHHNPRVQSSEQPRVARAIAIAVAGVAFAAFTANAHTPNQGGDQALAYSRPLAHLDSHELASFAAGKAEFAIRWVPPFLGTGQWGRGPQSNAASCLECHPRNGRGRAPDDADEALHSMVIRVAVTGSDEAGRARPHPAYGTHLNHHGILGKLIEEGDFRVGYRYRKVALADGVAVQLREPMVSIKALWYGPLGPDAIVSPRIAQPVFGLGLLEAVPEAALHDIAARQQSTGFNGRVNRVRDELTGELAAGRFGHKAAHPNLAQQVAAAFLEEIGVTSPYFPSDQCPPIQRECDAVERLSGYEAGHRQIDAITAYLSMLAPPAPRDQDERSLARGRELFDRAHCSVCHLPQLPVPSGTQAGRPDATTIRPYTDLLLHDMGQGLADGLREFDAGGRDWRTAPLWGLGLRQQVNGNDGLLHDGRARSVTEAILWHGGEAEPAREAFRNMNGAERRALLDFVDSL